MALRKYKLNKLGEHLAAIQLLIEKSDATMNADPEATTDRPRLGLPALRGPRPLRTLRPRAIEAS